MKDKDRNYIRLLKDYVSLYRRSHAANFAFHQTYIPTGCILNFIVIDWYEKVSDNLRICDRNRHSRMTDMHTSMNSAAKQALLRFMTSPIDKNFTFNSFDELEVQLMLTGVENEQI